MGEFLPLFPGIAVGLAGAWWLAQQKLAAAALCVAVARRPRGPTASSGSRRWSCSTPLR